MDLMGSATMTAVGDDDHAVTRRKRRSFLVLAAGALFVVVPNSAFLHDGLRAILGVNGIECC